MNPLLRINLPFTHPNWVECQKVLSSLINEPNIQSPVGALCFARREMIKQLPFCAEIREYDERRLGDILSKGCGLALDQNFRGTGTFDAQVFLVKSIFAIVRDMNIVFDNQPFVPLLDGALCSSCRFTRRQCACLISGAVLGVMALDQLTRQFDFGILFNRSDDNGPLGPGVLHYLFRYFNQATDGSMSGYVQFSRVRAPELSDALLDVPLCNVEISDQKMEAFSGMLQTDFAAKSIGGGAMGYKGAVQEEIRFGMRSPECLVCLLLCKELPMGDDEAILIYGTEIFSDHSGYGKGTQWKCDFVDTTPRNQDNSVLSFITCIDALKRPGMYEFSREGFSREVRKAIAGFSTDVVATTLDVATGRWGCGDFQCDLILKFLEQWIAASVGGKRDGSRKMAFTLVGNKEQEQKIQCVIDWVIANDIRNAKQLFSVVLDYFHRIDTIFNKRNFPPFFVYLSERIGKAETNLFGFKSTPTNPQSAPAPTSAVMSAPAAATGAATGAAATAVMSAPAVMPTGSSRTDDDLSVVLFDLEKTVIAQGTKNESLESAVTSMREELEGLKATVKQVSSSPNPATAAMDIAELYKRITSLDSRVKVMEGALKKLQVPQDRSLEIAEVSKRLASVEARLHDLEDPSKKAEPAPADPKVMEEVSQLSKAMQELSIENEELKTQQKSLIEFMRQLIKSRDSDHKEMEKMKEQMRCLQSQTPDCRGIVQCPRQNGSAFMQPQSVPQYSQCAYPLFNACQQSPQSPQVVWEMPTSTKQPVKTEVDDSQMGEASAFGSQMSTGSGFQSGKHPSISMGYSSQMGGEIPAFGYQMSTGSGFQSGKHPSISMGYSSQMGGEIPAFGSQMPALLPDPNDSAKKTKKHGKNPKN